MKKIMTVMTWAFCIFLGIMPIYFALTKYVDQTLDFNQIFSGLMLEFMIFMFGWFMVFMIDWYFKKD